jgi:isocitrate lyase
MKDHGLFEEVHDEVGQIIVARVDETRVAALLDKNLEVLGRLIGKNELSVTVA